MSLADDGLGRLVSVSGLDGAAGAVDFKLSLSTSTAISGTVVLELVATARAKRLPSTRGVA